MTDDERALVSIQLGAALMIAVVALGGNFVLALLAGILVSMALFDILRGGGPD